MKSTYFHPMMNLSPHLSTKGNSERKKSGKRLEQVVYDVYDRRTQ